MRFVLAIVAFAAAAVMIALGIAQRTVFLEPDRVALQVTAETGDADYLVIDPEALAANPGKQTLTIEGDGSVFLAYGRTSDILAWIGDDQYAEVDYDAEAGELVSRVVDPADEQTTGDASGTDDRAPATEAPAGEAPVEDAVPEGEQAPADAADSAPVSPAGSDLWLDELSEDGPLTTTIDVPAGVSVLVASGTSDAVPDEIAIAWPLDNSTPWVGPLLTGGAIAFLAGLALMISGIVSHRRSRGPRRNLPKGGPRRSRRTQIAQPGPAEDAQPAPQPSTAATPSATGESSTADGPSNAGEPSTAADGPSAAGQSRSTGKRALIAGLVLVPALGLTACSAEYWPSLEQAPETSAPATAPVTATPDDEAEATEAEAAEEVEPAVTVPQMELIMRKLSDSAAAADEARDPGLAAERFAGPALAAREANYAIRGVLPDHPASTAIPAAPLEITLPQQSKAGIWPRTVLTIVKNGDDPTVAPSSLVLVQQSPRDNFKILYAMSLVPDADPPEVAPASIGAPLVSPQSKLLVLAPDQVAAAYADVLTHGAESQYAELFETEGDVLLQQLGPEGQNATNETLPPTADAAYATQAGDSPPIALATNDSGAMISVSLSQTETVTPNDGGTLGFGDGQPGGALSGFTGKSAKGVQREIGIQVLFYVPAVGSDEKIRVLGWSESLIGASEVP
ncbi:hypothetical protein [Agromyces aerolatus]|uniref:hypothetical protein n=1 Tax=Agromyces sp. LY-1074 TaxID=3074080 RepID=UPI00285C6BFF|nr:MULTISPECIES: hypothetical protein [unclassified Agromyces]MDR5699921.1 hypothetical protein [Agromyces sp. LY-1074]MDR5706267.1 hypothetical protein [Agromyces sp. LY-1358]